MPLTSRRFTGIQFLKDCPKEPHIPIYMVVGGSVGCVKMGLTLYNQLHTRRMDATTAANSTSIGKWLVFRPLVSTLFCFLTFLLVYNVYSSYIVNLFLTKDFLP